jgi:hypothetical protein
MGREEDLRAAAALSPIADTHRRLVDPQSSLGHRRKAVRRRRARSQRSRLPVKGLGTAALLSIRRAIVSPASALSCSRVSQVK